MTDTAHLEALLTRLSHERTRLGFAQAAKSAREVKARKVWVDQLEAEVEAEYKFLGMEPVPPSVDDILEDWV